METPPLRRCLLLSGRRRRDNGRQCGSPAAAHTDARWQKAAPAPLWAEGRGSADGGQDPMASRGRPGRAASMNEKTSGSLSRMPNISTGAAQHGWQHPSSDSVKMAMVVRKPKNAAIRNRSRRFGDAGASDPLDGWQRGACWCRSPYVARGRSRGPAHRVRA